MSVCILSASPLGQAVLAKKFPNQYTLINKHGVRKSTAGEENQHWAWSQETRVLTNSCVSLKSKLEEDSSLIYKVEEDWNKYLITDQLNIPGEAAKEKGEFSNCMWEKRRWIRK